MIQRAIIIAMLVAGTGLAGVVRYQWGTIDSLKDNNATLTLALQAANAKHTNSLEDKASDDEIDNIPDDGLRTVPDRWLRQGTADGGLD